jgi:hypothetical protein
MINCMRSNASKVQNTGCQLVYCHPQLLYCLQLTRHRSCNRLALV